MQAQLCKICGVRHHRYEPHQWPDAPPDEAPTEQSDEAGGFGPPIRASFDRNAYQREYMRKRRAVARALRSKES